MAYCLCITLSSVHAAAQEHYIRLLISKRACQLHLLLQNTFKIMYWVSLRKPGTIFCFILFSQLSNTCEMHNLSILWSPQVDTIILTCKIQFSSVTQHCLTLCNCMVCSTPGLPVHHQLPEFAQTRLHWVSDAIQPSHPLSSPSPPAFNLSQHQGHF